MKNDKKLYYKESKEAQIKLSEQFLVENIKLLNKLNEIYDSYMNTCNITIPSDNIENFFNHESYIAIKKTFDNSILCTDYLNKKIQNGASRYEIIEIYTLLKLLRIIEKESLEIYKKITKDYLTFVDESIYETLILLSEKEFSGMGIARTSKMIDYAGKIYFNRDKTEEIKEKIIKK